MRIGFEADPKLARLTFLKLADRFETAAFRLSLRRSDYFGRNALHLKLTVRKLSDENQQALRRLLQEHPRFTGDELRYAVHRLLPARALASPSPHPKSNIPENLSTPFGDGVDDLLRRSLTAQDLYHHLMEQGLTFRNSTFGMQADPMRRVIRMAELKPSHRRYQTAILLEEMMHLYHINDDVLANALLSGDNPVRQVASLFHATEGVAPVQRHLIRKEIMEAGGPPIYDLQKSDPIVGGFREILQKMDAGKIDHEKAAVKIAEIRQREIVSPVGFNYHESYYRTAKNFVSDEAVQKWLMRHLPGR